MSLNFLQEIAAGDQKALAKAISRVENGTGDFYRLLSELPHSDKKIIGITGPPGAGKSTLLNALLRRIINKGSTAGVLCVDPSSPFHGGALLGDRIRMSEWYNHPGVFIRSLSTRGGLGGLSPKIIEIADLMKAAPFDHIIIETVGVGQNEIEIAELADTTVVVMVPEGGDEIQTMKAGLMEIADIFVVNKADRPGAELFIKNLRGMLAPAFSRPDPAPMAIPIVKTVATEDQGIAELMEMIAAHAEQTAHSDKKFKLLAEKAYRLILKKRMQDVDKRQLTAAIRNSFALGNFNLYRFVDQL